MLKPSKWLWLLDIAVGAIFISGIGSFVVWRRSEDFRKSTFSRVPIIADYFYRVCFFILFIKSSCLSVFDFSSLNEIYGFYW